MRFRREDDRLNLTAEMVIDKETGDQTLTMTSQPKTDLSAEDFYGATLIVTANGKPSAFVTFTSVAVEALPTMAIISAMGLFMVAGEQTAAKAVYINLLHTQSKDKATEKAMFSVISNTPTTANEGS